MPKSGIGPRYRSLEEARAGRDAMYEAAMGQTFDDLYQRYADVRNADYRNDADRKDAIIECMERTMFTLLEKLRDELES